jgi:hypothetical protein
MEYQANNEEPSISKDKKKIAEKLLIEGRSAEDTAKIVSVRKSTILSVKHQLQADGKMDMTEWRKDVAGLLGEFVQRGSQRLLENVDNISPAQLPMAIAIAIDKVRDLSDAQTVKIEARLKITQDELNNAFRIDTGAKDANVIDAQPIQNNNDQPTSTDAGTVPSPPATE